MPVLTEPRLGQASQHTRAPARHTRLLGQLTFAWETGGHDLLQIHQADADQNHALISVPPTPPGRIFLSKAGLIAAHS